MSTTSASDGIDFAESALDFNRLDLRGARVRVAQMIRAGMSEHQIASVIGWGVDDVSRVLGAAVDDGDDHHHDGAGDVGGDE